MYCTVFCKINEQKGKYTNRSNKDKKETTHLVCILHPISTLVTFTAVRIVALIESQQLPVFALLLRRTLYQLIKAMIIPLANVLRNHATLLEQIGVDAGTPSLPRASNDILINLPNREELSLRSVRALPNASKIALETSTRD